MRIGTGKNSGPNSLQKLLVLQHEYRSELFKAIENCRSLELLSYIRSISYHRVNAHGDVDYDQVDDDVTEAIETRMIQLKAVKEIELFEVVMEIKDFPGALRSPAMTWNEAVEYRSMVFDGSYYIEYCIIKSLKTGDES